MQCSRSRPRGKFLRQTCLGLLGLWCLSAVPLAAQTVTLNLKNADISALISTISEITGKNFIVDPRVKAKITVVSSKPMDEKEIYQVFLSVLEVHGFAVVPSGAMYKIIPDINAKQSATPTMGVDSSPAGDAVTTRIIKVKNVSAALLVSILRPLVPQQGHLAAYPTNNMLVVSDRAANIERLEKIIERIDQAGDSDVEVIQLQHASAGEVARILTQLARTGDPQVAAQGGGAPSFIADERTNSILMSGDLSLRVPMRAIVAHLDTPLESTGNTRVIYLRYAEASDLVGVLKGVGDIESKDPGRGGNAAAAGVAQQVAAAAGAITAARGGEIPFEIQADEATNALVITAAPDIMRSLEAVIRQLDVRRAQVQVEAIIAELSTDKAKQLGVQWIVDGTKNNKGPASVINFSNAGTGIAQLAASIASNGVAPINITSGASIGIGRITDSNSDIDFAALLQALASDGTSNILSTPTLVTLDNEEAEIIIGQNVPFVTGSFTSATGGGDGGGGALANPFQTIQREDVGIKLKITPQINEGDSIKLEISQEVSSVVPSTVATSDVVTDKRSIKTTVLVGDGRTVVLGGLIEDSLTESVQKVPLLGDIPFLGALFQSRNATKSKTNLMVFIRPFIVRDDSLQASLSGEKYNYLRTQQLERAALGVSLMPGVRPPVLPEYKQVIKNARQVLAPDKAPADPARRAEKPSAEAIPLPPQQQVPNAEPVPAPGAAPAP